MKKIADRVSVANKVYNMLMKMDGKHLIDLWNNRWMYGEDMCGVKENRIAHRIEEFEEVCKERGFTYMDMAIMMDESKGPMRCDDMFIADNDNCFIRFFNAQESKRAISVKRLAFYMTDYADGCGDKTIQDFLDAIAEGE